MSYNITYGLDENPFETREPPAPKVGAIVFGPRQEDWHLNAYLNYVPSESHWDSYADGYKRAGDLSVQFAGVARTEVDTLVYPITFNYRQYLELRLKELLMLTSYYLGHPYRLKARHGLLGIWRELRPKLEALSPGDPNLPGVEYVLGEFDKIDVRSDSFRFPVTSDGLNPSLPGITHINVGQLRDRIAEVAWVLDGWSAGMTEYLSAKREMLAEARQEAAYYAEPPEYYYEPGDY